MFPYRWTNIDVVDLTQYSATNNFQFIHHDLKNGIPFITGFVDYIYSSHFLEHLTYEEALKLLRECRRVLKTNGLMRFIVPDSSVLIYDYTNGDMGYYSEISDGVEKGRTQIEKLHSLMYDGHHALYDADMIKTLMEEADFSPNVVSFGKTEHGSKGKQILKETIDTLPCLSLYCEAVPKVR